jgi:hypothetical protein
LFGIAGHRKLSSALNVKVRATLILAHWQGHGGLEEGGTSLHKPLQQEVKTSEDQCTPTKNCHIFFELDLKTSISSSKKRRFDESAVKLCFHDDSRLLS